MIEEEITSYTHHPAIAQLGDLLSNMTQNPDKKFFHIEVAYYLAKIASAMRCEIDTYLEGTIPVNLYAIDLAPSGYGKGHSISIMESQIIDGFKQRFIDETMPIIEELNLTNIANMRAAARGTSEGDEEKLLRKELFEAGPYPFTFDSGTVPAIKQLRNKLLISNCGSINWQLDECGSNLLGSTEVLTAFLELFDRGKIKTKLVKNTAENSRAVEIDGSTPTNMLLFGTPVKLFDGEKTEEQFYSLLEIGYARRCFFGYGQSKKDPNYFQMSASELYDIHSDVNNKLEMEHWNNHFSDLADSKNIHKILKVPKPVSVELIAYQQRCEKIAEDMPAEAEIKKAEMGHRHFKALKLAGAFAFIDGADEISIDNIHQAIHLVEESGESFNQIMSRQPAYERLARYLASTDKEVTAADLKEVLRFYPIARSAQEDLMNMAIAFGYSNSILIRCRKNDGISFYSGSSLKDTNLDEIILSWSTEMADDYQPVYVSFQQLNVLGKNGGENKVHFCNHWFKDNHRADANAQEKFNLIVLDVDKGTPLETAKTLLGKYIFMTYTTKRHTNEKNRYRILIPMKYTLSLTGEEYKTFMNNVLEYIPFNSDLTANQPGKKWESNNGDVYFNNKPDAELFDPVRFIPNTSRNTKYMKDKSKISSLPKLERWFYHQLNEDPVGDRNNTLFKYACALKDENMTLEGIENAVLAFNKNLEVPLDEEEIRNTIFVSIKDKFNEKSSDDQIKLEEIA